MSDLMPLISICIPSYNHEKYLDYCFNSIKGLNYKNIEIIFSDDCSTDNSIEIAEASSINNLKILQSEHNYREQGLRTLLFTPRLDDRYGEGKITSRIGLQQSAYAFT